MVFRTSLRDAARRAQISLSRATLRKLNTKTLWSEAEHADVMPNETHTDVEWIQNYGRVSVPPKQDEEEEDQKQQAKPQQSGGAPVGGTPGKEGQQPKGDAAEMVVGYMNGTRDLPVILGIGDRRHHLKELEDGDVAQHRLKDDRQQFLLHKDGTYLSTRNDKVFRAALVPKETKDQQQQAGKAAGPQQAGGQQKQQKSYGQKSAREDNKKSEVAIEQNGTQTYSRHGESYGTQKGGSDSTIHYEQDKKKSAQSTETHTHIRFKDHRIFNDDNGNWSTSPILIKKDGHCKEG